MKNSILFAAVFAAGLSFGRPAGEMKITADKIAADNDPGVASNSCVDYILFLSVRDTVR